MSGNAAPQERDAAWVVLELPMPAQELMVFLADVQRLYRINPFLEFECWEQVAPDRFRARLLNHSNGQRMALEAAVTRPTARSLRMDYASGLKQSTRFDVEPSVRGSRLTVTDEYAGAADEATGALVDRSLHAWGVALKGYLERDRSWGRLPLYRWFMERVWLPMKPSARRITFVVLVVSVADVALIALGLTIYWLEVGR